MYCCSKKRTCSVCIENKYIQLICTRCIDGCVCYKCSSNMLEHGLINKCPVCNLKTTEKAYWYKSEKMPCNVILPNNNSTQNNTYIIDDDNDIVISSRCFRIKKNIYLTSCYIKLIIYLLIAVFLTHAIGLFIGLLFNLIDEEYSKESLIIILIIPFLLGICFWICLYGLIKCCCFNWDID